MESTYIIPQIGYIEKKLDVLMICTEIKKTENELKAIFEPYGQWKLKRELVSSCDGIEALYQICGILNVDESQRKALLDYINRIARKSESVNNG